jgi:hypothetical protein
MARPMKRLAICLCLFGCDSADSALSGTLAWKFDYRNWTNVSAEADERGCSNAPAEDPGDLVPAYPRVAKVNVVLDDPQGEVPGVDNDVDCTQGSGGGEYELRGLSERTYDMTLRGLASDGTELYRFDGGQLNFRHEVSESVTLRAVVGETQIFPRFPAVAAGVCPGDVERVRVRFYAIAQDGEVAAEPAFTHSFAACDADAFTETLYIRNIPADPPEDSAGPVRYEGKLEGLDAGGDVVYCSVPAAGDVGDVSQQSRFLRPIAPGGPSLDNSDVFLEAATTCP